MRTALPLVVALLLLAGCAQPTSTPVPADQVGVITDPRDFSDLNSTGAHVHDYWGGAQEKLVVDANLSSTWNNGGGSFAWRRDFAPPDESIVPQGTSSLTVSVDWRYSLPEHSHGAVSLWVKPANAADARFVQEVKSGDTVEIPTLYNESDLPHQLLSNWEFTVQYNSSGGPNLFFGTTHLRAVAHRGLPLQPFPAHPDQWHGNVTIALLDVASNFTNIGYTGSGNLPERYRPEEARLVPGDTAYVEVHLDTANNWPVGGLQLSYHAADSRQFKVLKPDSDQAGKQSFTIEVAPGMGDGPYNDASLWEFQVYTSSPGANQPPAVFSGTYHLTAIAHKSGA